MARLLRVPMDALAPGPLVLEGGAARYVSRVHRLRAGDRFVAFDVEARTEADVEVLAVGHGVEARVGELRPASRVARTGVTLVQALGKGDKPDQVVRDATALGVERLVFATSERSVVRVDGDRDERRRRLRSIAVQAARQSGRGDVPEIVGPLDYAAALSAASGVGARLCLVPGVETPLADALSKAAAAAARGTEGGLALLVGPEGGLSDAEIQAAAHGGFTPVSLFDFVLRTETAAVAALGAALGVRGKW